MWTINLQMNVNATDDNIVLFKNVEKIFLIDIDA